MSTKVSEVLPSFSNPILKTADRILGNEMGITWSAIDRSGSKIDLWSITPKNIAGEISKRLEWNKNSVINLGNFDEFENRWERKKLIKEQRVVNAIRFNGDTAFVTQSQRFGVAYSMAERLVGKNDEYTYGPKQDKVKDKERRAEFDVILDHLAVALGHKATIKEVEAEKKRREEQHL